MKLLRQLFFVGIIISFANACKKPNDIITTPVITPLVIAPPPPFGFYVVGYFPSYRVVANVPDVKFKMCNVINYAFANINASGNLVLGSSTHLTEVKNKAKVRL